MNSITQILNHNSLQRLLNKPTTTINEHNVKYSVSYLKQITQAPRIGWYINDKKINTKQEAEKIRILYRRSYQHVLERTKSRRTNILNAPHETINGIPTYYVSGFAVDTRFDPQGNLTRICLASIDIHNSTTGEITPVDTHMWLFLDSMHVDPTIIEPTSGLGSDLYTISLGDWVGIKCTLNVYGENKRIGIDQWQPIASHLVYGDLHKKLRYAPRHVCAGMELLHITRDEQVRTVSEQDWARTLLHALSRNPEEREAVFYGWGTAGKHYDTLSRAYNSGHLVINH